MPQNVQEAVTRPHPTSPALEATWEVLTEGWTTEPCSAITLLARSLSLPVRLMADFPKVLFSLFTRAPLTSAC